MKNRFIVFDVETPNYSNDRISSIGITIVEKGKIVDEVYSLINPETHFHNFNINLTGITPEMVANQPSFREFWPEIAPLMESGILIAHNATFDMGVLAKCFYHYDISWRPYAEYACTCTMGRNCYPRLQNHKLDTLCGYLGIDLDHHNAASDSRACAGLLIDYIGNGIRVSDFLHNYSFLVNPLPERLAKPKRSRETVLLLELKTFLSKITNDGVLTDLEIYDLYKWLDGCHSLRNNYPFDKVIETIEHVLEDGVIEKQELDLMWDVFNEIIDPVANIESCGDFNIKGKVFCLTGDFEYGSKSEFEKALVRKGGIKGSSVTLKTDILIVGSKGSAVWSAGNYGNKIKKAMEMQEKGMPIRIMKEEDIKCEIMGYPHP